jgi:hypothetical protein
MKYYIVGHDVSEIWNSGIQKYLVCLKRGYYSGIPIFH